MIYPFYLEYCLNLFDEFLQAAHTMDDASCERTILPLKNRNCIDVFS